MRLKLLSASVIVPFKRLDVELKDDEGGWYGVVPMIITVRRTI